MRKKMRHLIVSADFERYRIFSRPVKVICQGVVVGSGVILAHTDHAVNIDGERYLKATCEFFGN